MRQATQAVARGIIWQRHGARLNCTSGMRADWTLSGSLLTSASRDIVFQGSFA